LSYLCFICENLWLKKQMSSSIANTKSILRQKIRARLEKISPAVRAVESIDLCERLKAQMPSAHTILFFAPLPDEPDLWPLFADALADGKIVALPRLDPTTKKYAACQIRNLSEDLLSGQFGIREPNNSCPVVPLNRLDLILVPGVAFDLHGRRLGRGKGFYDQLLADVRGTTCGVAFDEQIVADIPMEPHDISLNCILTPTRWIEP